MFTAALNYNIGRCASLPGKIESAQAPGLAYFSVAGLRERPAYLDCLQASGSFRVGVSGDGSGRAGSDPKRFVTGSGDGQVSCVARSSRKFLRSRS